MIPTMPRTHTRVSAILMLIVSLSLVLPSDRLAGQDNRQLPTIEVSVSKESAYVADPIDITITVLAAETSTVSMGPVPSSLGDLEVVDHSQQFDLPAQETGQRVWVRRLTLEALMAGTNRLPPFEALVEFAGNIKTLKSRSIELEIKSTLPEASDPRQPADIAGTLDVDVSETGSLGSLGAMLHPIVLALSGGLSLLLVIWQVAKRSKRLPSPHQQAKSELALLNAKANQDDPNPHHTLRSAEHIVREFIERQANIPATKLTNNELVNQLARVAAMPRVAAAPQPNQNPDESPRPNSATLEKLEAWLAELERIRFSSLDNDPSNAKKLVDQANDLLDPLSDLLSESRFSVGQGS